MKLCPKCQKQFSDDANFCPVDAARLAPLESQSVAADALSAKFELGERLGGSRTGAVHRATDKATGQSAAVKIIAPEVVALPGLAQRLERELKQLERVQTAGVAKVLASGKRGDDVWVALELLDGAQTLFEGIAARGPLGAAPAAALIGVIGEALIEAAQVGVVHRDLAPKNVLFAGTDVKLINFSLPVPTTDKVSGVAEFVAPEQHDGKPVDQRSNLYSLGALYYFVLTGQPVQHEDTGAIKPPSSLVPVSGAVDAMILRALDRSPTKRFLTVRQFVDEVDRVARDDSEPKQASAVRTDKPRAELVQTLLGVIPGDALASAAGDRSPWAPPVNAGSPPAEMAAAPVAAAPVAAAPVAAAPVAAAPVTAAPVAAAPVAAARAVAAMPPAVLASPLLAAAANIGSADDDKAKFRETLWFKKGELDAEAAQAAAAERARTGKDHKHDKTDSLPIDERYRDDGSLSRSDKEKYSLRSSSAMQKSARAPSTGGTVDKGSEELLIGELKGGRNAIIAALVIGLVVIALIIFLVAR